MKNIFVTLLIIVSVVGCNKPKEVTEIKEVIRPVKYYKIVEIKKDTNRWFSGITMPKDQAKISFKIPGTINKIFVKVGDKVKKGTVLAELDSQIYILQLQEAQNALKNIKTKAKNAEAVYKRVQALYENQNASRNDLDQAKTGYELSQIGINTVLTKIQQANLQLKYTKIRASDDGSIAYVLQKENENIAAGMPVVVLNSGVKKEIEIGIPENLINKVKNDTLVDVKFDIFKDKNFKGKITKVGVSPQLSAPTFPVTIELTEDDEKVLTGMVAQVKLNFGKNTNNSKIIVPVSSVSEDKKSKYVFIANRSDEKFAIIKKVYIKIGKLTNKGFEVLSGLKVGDNVVTAGVNKIRDGLKVKMIGE
jgi:RND family efflux transporter MFP subunit